jgi:nicotinate-nucleotide pyrophosphorylase (carboxylating)
MTAEIIIQIALAEDLADKRDITSDLFIPPSARGTGWIEAREDCILSGVHLCAKVFETVDPALCVQVIAENGVGVERNQHILEIEGPASSLLRAERTALNFLGRLSGVATRTYACVNAVKPWGTKILGTRKTTPGLRDWEIEAIRHGGGDVYRSNLTDNILIKDNHLGICGGMRGIQQCLSEIKARSEQEYAKVLQSGKIEAGSLMELDTAVAMGWKQILLDNFSSNDVQQAVDRYGKQVFLEVSGGVSESNIEQYAATGVQAISIGALTHSSRSVDFSLEVNWRHS